jgi:hypothetical protein
MKGLFSRTRTIRELKAIVRNLSTQIKQVTRKFSKTMNIYFSWSRMNKKQLIKVVDWFLGNYSVNTIFGKLCTSYKSLHSYDESIKDAVIDLGPHDIDGLIAYKLIDPFEPNTR